ncbi:toxin-antitoxin system YwqK family antitoxin [Streptomyces sp. NPDC000229]|uniref:toxin-antitoxin system YwqK family antitoxin n=1 Tax=Streptomyces sp. NPDC000229 TaxID=3154247 RepID=UPI00331BFA34
MRIDIDDPDVDMDASSCLFYRGQPFTGEVAEYQAGQLISLDEYTDGRLNGLSREWYQDGTLRSEGVARDGRAVGEWKDWHLNGALKSRQLFDDTGYSVIEADTWDECAVPLSSWRRTDAERSAP